MNKYQRRINKITKETMILMPVSYYRARKITNKCIKYFGSMDFVEDIGACNVSKKILKELC